MAPRNNYILSAGGQATVFSIAFAVNHSDVAQYQSFFIMGQGRAMEYHRMGAFFIDDVDKYQVIKAINNEFARKKLMFTNRQLFRASFPCPRCHF